MLSLFAILITFFLEKKQFSINIRNYCNDKLKQYINIFTAKNIKSQKDIRLVYIFACIPIIIILYLLKLILLPKLALIYYLLQIFLFFISVDLLSWKHETKKNIKFARSFVHTYANKFFAPLFWFLVLPASIGAICYLLFQLISQDLKNKHPDNVVHTNMVDKMLFYANLFPYFILYLYIAIAGNFEDVTHYLIEQFNHFNKSFFKLDNWLDEIILIAINKDKFQISKNSLEDFESGNINSEKYNENIIDYIKALLYRVSIFFIITMAIISLAKILS